MGTRSSRRVPWPWDMRIATARPPETPSNIGSLRATTIGSHRGTLIGSLRARPRPFGLTQGMMLLPQGDTSLMIAKKQTNLENLYPSTAEYDSAPVYRERTFQFRPSGGMGEPVQASAASRRYHYGINVWITGGLFGKGPLVHPVTGIGASGIVHKFVEALHGGALALFILSGQTIYRRSDDSTPGQVNSRTRAGLQAQDAVRFTGAYSSAVDGLYAAWSDGVLEEYNGAGWTPCALPTGFSANFLCVLGNELWAADSARAIIRKCTGDPKLAASWSGPINIGSPSEKITALAQSGNTLAIFKDDGDVFTVNADGSDNDLFPGLKVTPDPDNGRAAVAWLSSVWFRSGRAWYELQMPGLSLVPRGPGRNLGNMSEVRGPVQCLAGWNTQLAFCAIYNENLGNSYLLSYGSWVPRADPDSAGSNVSGTAYTYIDQYDGALKRWSGRRVTAMLVSNIPSEARLYVGFADGNYDWIKLVPYPLLQGQGAEYTDEDTSYIVLPLHHAMFQSDNKHWTGASIFGPRMGQGNFVTLDYRVMARSVGTGSTASGGWLRWGNALVQNGQRVNPDDPIGGKALELRINLHNSGITETPTLEGLGLHERLVPAFRRDYTLTVNANDYVARRDGSTTRQSGATIRHWMEQAASAPASITMEFPDETLSEVALFSYEEHQTPHHQRGGLGMAISVQATQFKMQELYGIIGRLRGTRIGDLRGFTIGSLRYL